MVASWDMRGRATVPAGQQITTRLKDVLRPWASSLPQLSALPSWVVPQADAAI